LHLQLEGRKRRAKLVRGIGNEVLLRIEGMAHAAEQEIQLLHQRAHLVGQPLFADRRKIVGLPRGHLPAHPRDRCERPAHDPPDDQHQQRRHQCHGRNGAQRQGARHAAARGHVLRHLDHEAAGLHREHAVGIAARAHLGKAEHRELRQRRLLGRLEDAHAVRGPHLHHELEVLLAAADAAHGRARRQPGAQRQRHLLHVVVEDLVGLAQHGAVGGQRLHAGREHDRREQKPQQARAQGTKKPMHAHHRCAKPIRERAVRNSRGPGQEHRGAGFAGPLVLPPARGKEKRHEVREAWGRVIVWAPCSRRRARCG
jgi:hypothetical protein